jgi:hypothetical protein
VLVNGVFARGVLASGVLVSGVFARGVFASGVLVNGVDDTPPPLPTICAGETDVNGTSAAPAGTVGGVTLLAGVGVAFRVTLELTGALEPMLTVREAVDGAEFSVPSDAVNVNESLPK